MTEGERPGETGTPVTCDQWPTPSKLKPLNYKIGDIMLSKKLLYLACAVLVLCLAPGAAFADRDHDQDDDHGNGHAYGHDKHDRDGDRHDAKVERHEEQMERHEERHYYREHDRELHAWYVSHHDHLPPGLAKRDELPPSAN